MSRYLLATKLWERGSLVSTGSALLAAFDLHETEVRRAVDQCGEVVHSGATGLVVVCDDPVKAISLAVKLARAHSRHKSAIPLTCCVIEGELTSSGELEPEVVKLLRELLNMAGASEICIAPSLVSLWQERGNRPLKGYRREFSRGEKSWSLRFVSWEGHTREPKKRRRIKAVIYAALIALPSLIILAGLFWFSVREMRHDEGPAIIIGPFNASFTAPPCTLSAALPPITRGRLLDYCSLKGRGIQFHHLAEGSMQFSGRLSRRREGFELTVELTLYPRGVLYNRAVTSLPSPALEVVKKAIITSMKRLLDSYKKPTNVVQFADLFALCGVDKVPQFSVERGPSGEPAQVVQFKERALNTNYCLRDLILSLPRAVQGSSSNGSQ